MRMIINSKIDKRPSRVISPPHLAPSAPTGSRTRSRTADDGTARRFACKVATREIASRMTRRHTLTHAGFRGIFVKFHCAAIDSGAHGHYFSRRTQSHVPLASSGYVTAYALVYLRRVSREIAYVRFQSEGLTPRIKPSTSLALTGS